MRNIISIVEGTWKELRKLDLTSEQRTLMVSQKEEDRTSKAELIATIKADREISVTSEDVAIFEAMYNKVKPTLKAEDVYQLIGINIYYAEKTFGILNCRVNGEHKQIRF